MGSTPLQVLAGVLEAAGKPAELVAEAGGSRILVLPHGARVLGVFAPGSDENFLWTSSALGDAESARGLFASPGWCNTGGDRTWLAPEADFFLPQYPHGGEYHQPRPLDPGNYECTRDGNSVLLQNALTVHSYRTGADVEAVVRKIVEPAPNPLDITGKLEFPNVHAAGYSLRCSLEIQSGAASTAVGLWNLLQLPHGGEMLVATRKRAEVIVYFGAISAGELAAGERLVRWAMKSAGERKIGIPSEGVTGRAGYVYGSGHEMSLVVRDFTVLPNGFYVDAPWPGTPGRACAFQACNVRTSGLGSFSEMEYHAPAIGGESGRVLAEDTSQVRCFRGPVEAIRLLAADLLGG